MFNMFKEIKNTINNYCNKKIKINEIKCLTKDELLISCINNVDTNNNYNFVVDNIHILLSDDIKFYFLENKIIRKELYENKIYVSRKYNKQILFENNYMFNKKINKSKYLNNISVYYDYTLQNINYFNDIYIYHNDLKCSLSLKIEKINNKIYIIRVNNRIKYENKWINIMNYKLNI